MEAYQITGILFALSTVAAIGREFWKAFGGPDRRPRRYVSGEPAPIMDAETFGEPVILPPFPRSVLETGTDDEFITALANQYELPPIVPQNALNKVRPFNDGEFDPDTLQRVAEISRRHDERMARLKKAGLKLNLD